MPSGNGTREKKKKAASIRGKSSSYASWHLHGDEEQDEVWTPSECYNRSEYDHPQAAFQRRLNAAGREEFWKDM